MRTLDSRGRNGGIFPLQHKNFDQRGYTVETRVGMLAGRIKDRRTDVGELGHYEYEPESKGDIVGAVMWPSTDERKQVPAWSWLFPVVTVAAGNGIPAGETGEATRGPTPAHAPKYGIRPIREDFEDDENQRIADERFRAIDWPPAPLREGRPLWPELPRQDYFGLAVSSLNENRQVEYLLPTDPRLVAVHAAGEPDIGSWVCDLDGEHKIDLDRTARLQSFARVCKTPITCAAAFPFGDDGKPRNSIAWTIGLSKQGDVAGGMVWDQQANNAFALVSRTWFGFIVADDFTHQLGSDADGNPICQAALALDSNFSKRGGEWAAPLKHDGIWQGAGDAPFSTFVFFEYDRGLSHEYACGVARGKHRWRAKTFWYRPQPVITPPPGTPPGTPPEFPPLQPPIEKVILGGRTAPDGEAPTNRAWVPGEPKEAVTASIWPVMAGHIIGRAHHYGTGQIDMARIETPSPDLMADFDGRAPAVVTVQFIAQQFDNGDFARTEEPDISRFAGGTAPGMMALFSPESSAHDYVQPAMSKTKSTAYLALENSVRLAWFDDIDFANGAPLGGPSFAATGSAGARNLALTFRDSTGAARIGEFFTTGTITANGFAGPPIRTVQTESGDATVANNYGIIRYTGTGGHTFTLPAIATAGTGQVIVVNDGSGDVTMAGDGSQTVEGSTLAVAAGERKILIPAEAGNWVSVGCC